ncbi:MAG: LLM class flavin-dependent oxidoreductase [Gemmatimonadales bacterium]|nr:MAG: LLM class flavin-dependent oxidoreductase [Gemmatimonadales bacterium]
MATVGFHASHEQHPPDHLLRCVVLAEEAGFQAAMCSDHFHPWSERQGESGFAWAWLGAALQATGLPMGVVNAPGQRYHPAIVAQASATLATMFPGRFWLAVGSGQNLNEHITGDGWPVKDDRNARLLDSAAVIRDLWAGETVTHRGHVTVEDAKLYTRPDTPPPLYGAAITPETARWVAGWADGLITIAKPPDEMARVVDAFREGGGEGKPMILQVQLSYARSEGAAEAAAVEQWGTNILESAVLAELRMPGDFEAAAEFVRTEDLEGPVRISSEPRQHVEWIRSDIEAGFSSILLHNVHPDQETFIGDFGEHVLPQLGES